MKKKMKRSPEQKWRDGPDWTAIIIVLGIISVVVLGVLFNKGLIGYAI